jgi:regulator of replication initiation timing
MAKTATGIEVEPIDRLEEKVKRLVSVLDGLRSEQARAKDDNQRLTRELESTRTRLADAEMRLADQERKSGEVTALKEERELVKQRVADMLAQLDALNL